MPTKRVLLYALLTSVLSALFMKVSIYYFVISPNLKAPRGMIDRNGGDLLVMVIIWTIATFAIGLSLYRGEPDKKSNPNLSYYYHGTAILVSLAAILISYNQTVAVWAIDIAWVVGVSLATLLVHYLYKRKHINGVNIKKSLN